MFFIFDMREPINSDFTYEPHINFKVSLPFSSRQLVVHGPLMWSLRSKRLATAALDSALSQNISFPSQIFFEYLQNNTYTYTNKEKDQNLPKEMI